MKIQWITYSFRNINNDVIDNTLISNPNALDSYDINVLDLNNENIWRWDEYDIDSINISKDLQNFIENYNNSKRKELVIILPQNVKYLYCFHYVDYQNEVELKNILDVLSSILVDTLYLYNVFLRFENNKTLVDQMELDSAFYFITGDSDDILTTAKDSEKPTTIKRDGKYITTLNINTPDKLVSFLKYTDILKEKEYIPEWLKNYSFFNDREIKKSIEEKSKMINQLNEEINELNTNLENNEYYKSILIENGNRLVDIIFSILDEIFDLELESFKDIKKEDFLFVYKSTTFIGEIKGVTSNVKKTHIAQLDEHYSNYIDDMNEEEMANVKQILIINHQRDRELSKREPIHNDVIIKAKKNDVLIIETKTLLDIYEMYKNERLSKDDIYEMFLRTGLLTL